MKPIKWILLVVFLGLIISQMASALESAQYCVVFDNSSIDWSETESVPKFDPSLGTLTRVTVTADASACQSLTIDAVGFWTAYSVVAIDTTTSTGGQFALVPLNYWRDGFGPYREFLCDIASDEFVYDDPAELAAWIGSDDVEFATTAIANFVISGDSPSEYRIASYAGETICVAYEYEHTPPLCINGSKINDCTEQGIPGWEICLIKPDGEIACTTTDENGNYLFCGLERGDYTLFEEDRDGWMHLDEPHKDVTLVDESAEGVDFYNVPFFCISGNKYNRKTGEGLSGWTINLKDATGAVIRTTTTGPGGFYEFCELVPDDYEVCEVMKSGWAPKGPSCIPVNLECEDSEDNDFENEPNAPCRSGCQWSIKNELYTASCKEVKVVDAGRGILANDPAGSIVVDQESITIDPRYGSVEVHEDGSFVYDPTEATRLYSGAYVIFKYWANNSRCDAKYPGITKIQIRC